jgi:uncharacterized metal-binding protein YceD (DUF177 family)
MTTELLLHPASLENGPLSMEGILPGSVLDLDGDPAIRVRGGISYVLVAEKLGDQIMVRGSLEVPLDLECSRSGAFFSTTCRDSTFLRHYSISEVSESIDLTEEIREAVLLGIPTYPVSPEAQSEDFVLPGVLPADTPPDAAPGGSPWSTLDDLNLS